MTSATTAAAAGRINLRLRRDAKDRLERAAAHEGKSISAFILSYILPKAEETIQAHEVMHISGEYAEAFIAALDQPPPYNAALRAIMEEHSQRVISR